MECIAAGSAPPSGGDGANSKRKLEIAHSTPMAVLAMDSQSKVRRRGSSLSSTDSTAMKRSLSDGTINSRICCVQHVSDSDHEGAGRDNGVSCPISPSSTSSDSVNEATAQLKALSPRELPPIPRTNPFSPLRTPLGIAVAPRSHGSSPDVFNPSPSRLHVPSSAPTSPQQPPSTLAINLQIPGVGSPHTSSAAIAPSFGRTASLPKRSWQPSRKSRNPGNLSLDLSQMDQPTFDSVDGKTSMRRDQAAICSKVTEFLFIGGAAASKDRDNLLEVGITHIINCAASIAPSFYPDDFRYYNLRLRDHSSQDISRYFYNVFEFIETARMRGGKVFIHCVKGISRSPTMAIAYLMWSKGIDVYKALEFVRQARPAVDPNAGFIFQLTEWEQLRAGGKLRLRPSVFRIELPGGCSGNGNGARAPEKPLIIGPLSSITEGDFLHPSEETAKFCFIVSSTEYLFVWCGSSAADVQVEAAHHAAVLLRKYEAFPSKCEVIMSGQETRSFWEVLEALQPQSS